MKVTIQEMISCAKREAALRKNFYPGFVKRGAMTPQKADEERDRMSAIISLLEYINAYCPEFRGVHSGFEGPENNEVIYDTDFNEVEL